MTSKISADLLRVAERHSKPFCYNCYEPAPTGRCDRCGSDDLMRLVPGVGVEWGLDWVAEHLVSDRLSPVDVDAAFEEFVAECYPDPIKIGWIESDAVSAIKALDPVSWSLAQSEWVDNEVSDDVLVTFDNGSTYYRASEVEQMIEVLAPEP